MLKFFVFSTLLVFSSARWTGGDHSIWADYKKTFNLIYKTEVEELERLKCFVKNLELIEAFNAEEEDGGATYGLNEYSHMCHHEFKAHFGGGLMVSANRTKRYSATFHPEHAKDVAAKSVDWRKMGAVTHVKNQGQCGSCWAFSAVGCMEGVHFVKTGKLLDLSEEELVQCSGKEGNMGCQGGIMDKAFEWVAQNGGIDSESDYPYTSGTGLTGNCNSKKERKSVAQFTTHVDVPEDEEQMAAFLAKNGPISVAVDAGPKWQLYRSGVKTSCFAGQLDHGVLIVGFGEDKGIPYWIIKNSWGPVWGEGGYIRIKRGVNCNGVKENACSAEP